MNSQDDPIGQQLISLAEVSDVTDASRSGRFVAKIKTLGGRTQTVNYVSPYASKGVGAFVGIPQVGVQILVCQPHPETSEWYYMGSTFAPEPLNVIDGQFTTLATHYPLERAAPLLYRARGVPMGVQFTGPEGGGISVTTEYNPDFINSKTEITSNINKKITLSDSPAIDAIILDSGNGSTIKISDNPQKGTLPARSIEVQSVGPQKYINLESQTDILVRDGRELQLLNNSTGANAAEDEKAKSGNVNIQSKLRDVNVFTQAKEGRIFIECLNVNGNNQVIEIQTNGADGAIRIKTNGKVDIQANNIGINATGNIDMKAGGAINIDAGGNLSLRSGGTVYSDGSPDIRLNEGGSNFAEPNIGNTESAYDNSGITTY